MKRKLALILTVIVFLMISNVPIISEFRSEDPYKIYNEYKDSLLRLQQDIAHIYMELQRGKNPQPIYEHLLQSIESTATLIGKAELASQHVADGLQMSLWAQMDVLFIFGLTIQQKKDLTNLGYTEEDITKILESLAHYDDYYYSAVTGFTTEEIEWFHSMGLTDGQITELQNDVRAHYVNARTYQELVKQHQSKLLYIQILLSMSVLQIFAELGHHEKDKYKSELKNAEKKLMEAILNVSTDQSSLERVKALSKQVYKMADQEIRSGKEQYFVDFFIGLQIHCGALTALHGDLDFGLAEIRLYTSVLSECIILSERLTSSSLQADENSIALNDIPENSPEDIVHIPNSIEEEGESQGQVEESDETNNVGWVSVLIKASDSSDWGFWRMVYTYIVTNLGQALALEEVKYFLTSHIGDAAALYVTSAGGVILTVITTAPGIGETWRDSIPYDPAGFFTNIIEDKETIEEIERGARSGRLCRQERYCAVLRDPGVIVYTIMCAERIYRSPWGNYFYYMKDNSGYEWVVEVQDMQYGLGRVAQAHRVGCGDLEYFGTSYNTIYDMWESCLHFTQAWERPSLN